MPSWAEPRNITSAARRDSFYYNEKLAENANATSITFDVVMYGCVCTAQ